MVSDSDRQKVYSAGDCPVCSSSGAVLLLKARDSGKLFFLCPLCGVAWPEPPPPFTLETIFDVKAFAPAGVGLPSAEEALNSGFALTDVPFEEWRPLLEDLLA